MTEPRHAGTPLEAWPTFAAGRPLPDNRVARPPRAHEPFARLGLAGARTLLIAATGGHAAQLLLIARAARVHPDSVFVTFAGVQSAEIAEHYRVVEIPYIPPRGWRKAIGSYGRFARLLREQTFDVAVSTGSAVAVPGLTMARARGVRSVYIESYTRYLQPSVSGTLLRHSPGIATYAQHDGWAEPWGFDGSVLDVLQQAPIQPFTGRARKLLVTFGTIRPYRFDAVVDRLLPMLPADVDVTWQLGATTRHDLPGEVHEAMSTADFEQAILEADLVVSHGGTGTILKLLTMGRRPILVPRRMARDEHVDDHQLEVCADLEQRGLVTVREVDALSPADFGWTGRPASDG